MSNTDDELDKFVVYDDMEEKFVPLDDDFITADMSEGEAEEKVVALNRAIKAYTDKQIQEALNTYVNLHYYGIKTQLKGYSDDN